GRPAERLAGCGLTSGFSPSETMPEVAGTAHRHNARFLRNLRLVAAGSRCGQAPRWAGSPRAVATAETSLTKASMASWRDRSSGARRMDEGWTVAETRGPRSD